MVVGLRKIPETRNCRLPELGTLEVNTTRLSIACHRSTNIQGGRRKPKYGYLTDAHPAIREGAFAGSLSALLVGIHYKEEAIMATLTFCARDSVHNYLIMGK